MRLKKPIANGTTRSIIKAIDLWNLKFHLFIYMCVAGDLVSVVIPRPSPSGEQIEGLGKVC